jgi:hypothetical protein
MIKLTLRTLQNALLGCTHRRTTFPLTPRRELRRPSAAPNTVHRGMYVVCLDCGREFCYDWQEMHIGEPLGPAAIRLPAFNHCVDSPGFPNRHGYTKVIT